MKIELVNYTNVENWFKIVIDGKEISSCRCIAKLFNLDIDTYNKLLIEKVIQHDSYYETDFGEEDDFEFGLNNIPKEVYVERFKETFLEELTTLALGGISNDN